MGGSETGQPTGGSALDGADRDPEQLGHLGLGEVVVVAQDDHGALPLRQRGQQADELVVVLGARGGEDGRSGTSPVVTSLRVERQASTFALAMMRRVYA